MADAAVDRRDAGTWVRNRVGGRDLEALRPGCDRHGVARGERPGRIRDATTEQQAGLAADCRDARDGVEPLDRGQHEV